jgi:hypothetical protein
MAHVVAMEGAIAVHRKAKNTDTRAFGRKRAFVAINQRNPMRSAHSCEGGDVHYFLCLENLMPSQFTRRRLTAVRCAGAVLITFAVGLAISQPMPKEGNYDYISCWSGTSNDIQFSKSHGFGGYEFVVTNRTTPPGGPFDMTVARCIGMYTMFEGKFGNSSYCEATDQDGDKFIMKNSNDGPKPKQEGITGTGKYEGMTRSGTSEVLGRFPMVRPGVVTGCARQTGTYKLK